MPIEHYAVATAGTITNIILWDSTTPALTLPTGEGLTTALDALTPMPQIGWAATEAAGVWTFTAPAVTPPVLSPIQAAQAALSAGIQIVSTGTPALSATYDIGAASQLNINSTWNYVMKFGTFFGGAATYAWADAAGTPRIFPSVVEFEAFAAAVGTYVAALMQIIAGTSNAPGLPSPVVTIP